MAAWYYPSMPKRSSKREDSNQTAHRTLLEAIGEKPKTPAVPPPDPTKNPAAVALGRLGGLKGGKARAKKMTKAQRVAVAKKGAAKRWGHDAD
jgi:hypothetical protein